MASVLAQDYPDLEIVVQDNASTDGTAAILAGLDDPRLRVVRTETLLPIAANWNSLVGRATGELVKVVCADDLVHPEIVSRQVEVMRADPSVSLVSTRRHMISEDGVLVAPGVGLRRLTGRHSGRETVKRVVHRGGNPLGEPACTMFRRAHFVAEGGFDASLMFPMDIDLWVRLLRHGAFYGIATPLAAFRLGSSSISSALTPEQYADQHVLAQRIGRDPHWRLSPSTRALARAGTINARARHRALFLASAWRNRQRHRGGDPRDELDWLR